MSKDLTMQLVSVTDAQQDWDNEQPFDGYLEEVYLKIQRRKASFEQTRAWSDNFSDKLRKKMLRRNEEAMRLTLQHIHHHISGLGIMDEARTTFRKLSETRGNAVLDFDALLAEHHIH